VAGVPWLRDCERYFLEELLVKLRREAFAKREPIISEDELVILTAGMAAFRGGAFLAAGASWGDIILQSRALRDTTPVVALSYCEVAKLSRHDLFEVLHHFPASRKPIQQAALLLATRRAMIIISVYARRHIAGRRASLTPSTPKGGDERYSKVELTTEQLKEPHKLFQFVMVDGLGFNEWREIIDVDGARKLVGAAPATHSETPIKAEVSKLLADVDDTPPSQQLNLVAHHVMEMQLKTDRALTEMQTKTDRALGAMDAKVSAISTTMDKLLMQLDAVAEATGARAARRRIDNPLTV
jgi:hypothetical protein